MIWVISATALIGLTILVAGFPESINIPEIENFFTKPVDYKKIKGQKNTAGENLPCLLLRISSQTIHHMEAVSRESRYTRVSWVWQFAFSQFGCFVMPEI